MKKRLFMSGFVHAYLIILLISYLCKAMRDNSLRVAHNILFELLPIYSNVQSSIEKTPEENIITKHKIRIVVSKPKYPYSKCGKDINVHLDSDFGECDDDFINNEARYLHATHFELRNVLANSWGSWAVGRNYIAPPRSEYGMNYWPDFFDMCNGMIIYEVNELILTGFKEAREIFGHMMADILAPLLLIPEDIRERSYVVGSKKKFVNDYLKEFGFRDEQIIKIADDKWIYAHILHVFTDKRSISSYNGFCVEQLQIYFEKHFHLNEIAATKYFLLNRKSSRGRTIDNFADLVRSVKKTFPEKKWKIFVEVNNITETAKNWASTKLVVQIDGSNCFNCIFMKRGTILCTGSSTHMDFCSAFFIFASHHFVYWFPVPGVDHITYKSCVIDIEYAIYGIRKCLFCEAHGYFPASE